MENVEEVVEHQDVQTMGNYSLLGALSNGMEKLTNLSSGSVTIVITGGMHNIKEYPKKLDLLIENLEELKTYLQRRSSVPTPAVNIRFDTDAVG